MGQHSWIYSLERHADSSARITTFPRAQLDEAMKCLQRIEASEREKLREEVNEPTEIAVLIKMAIQDIQEASRLNDQVEAVFREMEQQCENDETKILRIQERFKKRARRLKRRFQRDVDRLAAVWNEHSMNDIGLEYMN
ncbi:hypothetical protein G9A89_002118 [Geosiphon pyriformis]|nr:hypothetical protein G9A89_002118 [Geosiphon pyriformis]